MSGKRSNVHKFAILSEAACRYAEDAAQALEPVAADVITSLEGVDYITSIQQQRYSHKEKQASLKK